MIEELRSWATDMRGVMAEGLATAEAKPVGFAEYCVRNGADPGVLGPYMLGAWAAYNSVLEWVAEQEGSRLLDGMGIEHLFGGHDGEAESEEATEQGAPWFRGGEEEDRRGAGH